ncbi:MAG TPA: hypothetical protein VNZ45_10375 [Bacteroidia bacterium]|jgi:hypothetical protein|nr:hypothetical protein [Bacteroidia bacterium]
MKKIISLSFAICLLSFYGYCQSKNLDYIEVTNPVKTERPIKCGPEGSDSVDSNDPRTHLAYEGNPHKNRYDIPESQNITIINIDDLIASDAIKSKYQQGIAVQVTGYVDTVKPGDPESCNCGTKDVKYEDTHIELTPDDSHTSKKYRMVVEVTPRLRMLKGSSWTTAELKSMGLHFKKCKPL